MKIKDYIQRFEFVFHIFVGVICAISIYYLASITGLFDIDFSAMDNGIAEKYSKNNIEAELNYSLIPRPKNIGEGDVDINKATAEELESLPGIGPKKAQAITEQRTKMGGFSTLRDIMCTEGIGLTTYEEIKSYIKIGE